MKLNFCALCGSTDNLEHHHVLPKSLGGSDNEDNLLTLCSTHHVQLHNLSPGRINSSILIKAAKAKQREQGIFLGGHVPFGYRLKNDKLIKNAKEQRIIAEIIDLRNKGMTLREISAWLLDYHNIKRSHTMVATMIETVSSHGA